MKGQKLFEQIQDEMKTMPVRLLDAMQPNLIHPSNVHPLRMEFENDYKIYGFEYVAKKYGDMGIRNWNKRIVIIIKDTIRRILIKLKKTL